ncbi:MAG: hypothetical protein ABIK82_16220 [Pseudomonadota bacterium]
MKLCYVLILLCPLLASLTGLAAELSGSHGVWLSNAEGERQRIGTVLFTPAGGGRTRFQLTIDESLKEYFLAMRPFRCLTGPRQRLCHFPVAREAPLISAGDLVPLEYALMFIRTAPKSLHIDAFNGIYYRMRWTGQGVVGQVHDVAMDPFIAPDSVPVERRQRPIGATDLTPGDPRSHWLPILTIE